MESERYLVVKLQTALTLCELVPSAVTRQ